MTAGELIVLVDDLRPNAYSMEQKLRWLRRLDGQILCELEDTHGALRPQPCHCEPVTDVTGVAIRPLVSGDGERIATASERTGLAMTEAGRPAALPGSYGADTELLAPFPWDEGLYTAWLFCQIDLHNGEIQKYNQSLSLLAAAWRSLADWVNRSRRPKGVAAWRM